MLQLAVFIAGLLVGAALCFVILQLARRTANADSSLATRDIAAAQVAAGERLEHLLAPLRGELERYDQRLGSFDRERAMQFGALSEQLHVVTATSEALRDETRQLASALRAPASGGRWGEIQLRRVVELAGMSEHCDFETQLSTSADVGEGDVRRLRPDMVVRLPGGRSVIVDAKAPMAAYLDAAHQPSDRAKLLRTHAAQLRTHVDSLARKSYWQQLGPGATPEFVVLFLPGEAFFAAALEADPALLDDSASRGVILATPTTLIALLRAVSFGWREARMAEGAREISSLAATLYERLATLGGHVTELGSSLDRAVTSYNRAVGSLESRVFVTARRLRELGVAPDRSEIEPLAPVGTRARHVQAPELTSSVGADSIPPHPVTSFQ